MLLTHARHFAANWVFSSRPRIETSPVTSPLQSTPRLALTGITKRYPSVVANDDIALSVLPGEIHAVLGENGAGKSTLMKIIYGAVRPDAGEIHWEGQPTRIDSPAAARKLGIGMVFQHFSLFETLTVAENISLALDDAGHDLKALAGRIRNVSAEYGLEVDPARHVHSLSVGERQRVEIVRCLLQTPRLLIMDEPTSVLTPQAVQKLFTTLRRLASEGCSIVYISHKLDEIRDLCDRATVLRAGRVSGHAVPREETAETLAQMMIGRALPQIERRAHQPGDVLLSLRELSMASEDPFGTSLHDVTLDVHAGEIVGIAGVSGNGQAELLAALSGEVRAPQAEALHLNGRAVGRMGAATRRRLGLAFVPRAPGAWRGTEPVAHGQRVARGVWHGAPRIAAWRLDSSPRAAALRVAVYRALQCEGGRAGCRSAESVGRQFAEVHRRARNPSGAEGSRGGPADMGCRRWRGELHSAAVARPVGAWRRGAGAVRRA